ncbi:hypothetical protein TREMEDRAFT_57776 [Tremella mesenterica DSM 1558]|nr:uncharacterized protein TREMEDRAFT_57776 [Tremella mesenterica DSM 1558]EIW66638.1 hypothetical protein TREMEDRAFT_57776 [Tremella mesenterica DSM 1558]
MSHSLSSSSSTESECLTPLSAINSAIIPELILPSPDAEEEIHGYVETGTNVGSGEEVSNVKRQHGEESVLGVTGLGKVGGVGWFGGGYSG